MPLSFPTTPDLLEKEIKNLVENGKVTRNRSEVKKPLYFKNFRIIGSSNSENTRPNIIDDRNTSLIVECEMHGNVFKSSARYLVSTSTSLRRITCRFCESAAGEGHALFTLADLEREIDSSDHFGWQIDYSSLPDFISNPRDGLRLKNRIPLICKLPSALDASVACGESVHHTLGNILHSMRKDPGHLRCQGACDSRAKGKASRRSEAGMAADLIAARDGVWSLSARSVYVKKTAPAWYRHKCGNEVFRIGNQITRYPSMCNLQGDTSDDCPFCVPASPISCLNGSIEDYKVWAKVVRNGFSYAGPEFPLSADIQLLYRCENGHEFSATQNQFLSTRFGGCRVCLQVEQARQRAWSLAVAKRLIDRRFGVLIDDPRSYTIPTRIDNGSQVLEISILEYIKANPIFRPFSDGVRHESFSGNDGLCFYFAGLLATDGCVTDRGEVKIELNAADECAVKALAEFVSFPRHIKYRSMKNVGGRGIYASVCFRSGMVIKDLAERFGIVPRKTHTIGPPKIPLTRPQMCAYLIGLIDGDGSIGRSYSGSTEVTFCSSSVALFEWVVESISSLAGVQVRGYNEYGQHWKCNVGGSAADRLIKELLSGSGIISPMRRKWETLDTGGM